MSQRSLFSYWSSERWVTSLFGAPWLGFLSHRTWLSLKGWELITLRTQQASGLWKISGKVRINCKESVGLRRLLEGWPKVPRGHLDSAQGPLGPLWRVLCECGSAVVGKLQSRSQTISAPGLAGGSWTLGVTNSPERVAGKTMSLMTSQGLGGAFWERLVKLEHRFPKECGFQKAEQRGFEEGWWLAERGQSRKRRGTQGQSWPEMLALGRAQPRRVVWGTSCLED